MAERIAIAEDMNLSEDEAYAIADEMRSTAADMGGKGSKEGVCSAGPSSAFSRDGGNAGGGQAVAHDDLIELQAERHNDDGDDDGAAISCGEEDGEGSSLGAVSSDGSVTAGSHPPPLIALSRKAPTTDKNTDEACLPLTELETVATLGIGGFGRVNLVRHPTAIDQLYALKVLNKAHVSEMGQRQHVLSERRILGTCRPCPFIVHLHHTYRDTKRLYMLMEYCPGGEVWTMLRNWGRFDEPTARFYCAAAVEAFDFLHARQVMYRDLKPENMLLDGGGWPKLADFGFAKRLKAVEAGEGAKTWTFCGTAEYVAPEIILNKGQDTAVDIWALGIFLFELLSGTPPFASTDPIHTYNAILRGVQCLAYPRYISDASKQLICRLCRREPSQRLGSQGRLEEVRADGWFGAFDFAAFRSQAMRPPIRPKLHSATDTQNFDRYPATDNFRCAPDTSGWDEEF